MSDENGTVPVWHHFAVAIAYAATYEILQNLANPQLLLIAALRVGCLLMTPRRFWPALVMGETLAIAGTPLAHAAEYGASWAVVVAIPPILLCMPIIDIVSKPMSTSHRDGATRNLWMLLAIVACTLLAVLRNCIAYSLLDMGDGSTPPALSHKVALDWSIGYYLGALSLTPLIFTLRDKLAGDDERSRWTRQARARILRDIVFIALPFALAAFAGALYIGGDALPYFRMATILPVVALTLRQGWHGTAVGSLIACATLSSSALAKRDPSLLAYEALLALVITTCLMVSGPESSEPECRPRKRRRPRRDRVRPIGESFRPICSPARNRHIP